VLKLSFSKNVLIDDRCTVVVVISGLCPTKSIPRGLGGTTGRGSILDVIPKALEFSEGHGNVLGRLSDDLHLTFVFLQAVVMWQMCGSTANAGLALSLHKSPTVF
jgi:hypothetical protein